MNRSNLPIPALILIAVGLLLFADQRGWLDFGSAVAVWWPLILILVASAQLSSGRRHWAPWVLLGIGLIFLAGNLELLPSGTIRKLWPLALVAAGFVMLIRSNARPRSQA